MSSGSGAGGRVGPRAAGKRPATGLTLDDAERVGGVVEVVRPRDVRVAERPHDVELFLRSRGEGWRCHETIVTIERPRRT